MPLQLVRDAIEQSRTREPLVNVMTLLTGARVLAYMDLPTAKQAFEEGMAGFEQLCLDVRTAQAMRHEIVQMAVPVDPEAAIRIYQQLEGGDWLPCDGRTLIGALAAHGFASRALDLLEDPRYSAEGASFLIHSGQDPAFQVRVLRAARARWQGPRHFWMMDEFPRLFSGNFRILEEAEATAWLDELLLRVETMPNDRIRAGFGDKVQLDTLADMHIFELLNALRALKPPALVEAVLKQYPSVAAAAKDFPNGIESIFPTSPKPRPVAGSASIPLNPSISITHLLEEAHHIFIEDVNSNSASRAFWPSLHAYKLALYWAGERDGRDGSRYLQAVPDADIAILAAIELAGGILGLPMRGGIRLHRPSFPRPQ